MQEIKSRFAMAKAAFNKKKTLFTSKLDLNLRKKLVKCYIWSMALYGAETWTLRAADQKYLESFEMWCWRRMEKISWIDHVRNEEVLLRFNEQRDILHEIRKRKANWIGYMLCRNCLQCIQHHHAPFKDQYCKNIAVPVVFLFCFPPCT
jgi:hypothetical protein